MAHEGVWGSEKWPKSFTQCFNGLLNTLQQVGPFSSQHEMLSKCGATLRTPDFFATLTEQAKEDNRVGNQQDDYCKWGFQLSICTVIPFTYFVSEALSN